MRHILVIVASFCVLMFSMFSLTPLGSGQSGVPIFDGAMKWVQTQQLDWNIMLGQAAQIAQQTTPQQAPATVAPVTTTDTTTDTNLPKVNIFQLLRQPLLSMVSVPFYLCARSIKKADLIRMLYPQVVLWASRNLSQRQRLAWASIL